MSTENVDRRVREQAKRTVRVKIAVVLGENGICGAASSDDCDDDTAFGRAVDDAGALEGATRNFWLTAELPVPVAAEIVASVEEVAK